MSGFKNTTFPSSIDPLTPTAAGERAAWSAMGTKKDPDGNGHLAYFYNHVTKKKETFYAKDGNSARNLIADLILLRAVELLTGLPREEIENRIDLGEIKRKSPQRTRRIIMALEELNKPRENTVME